MLYHGLYEQVINNALTSELAEIPEALKAVAPIDKVEGIAFTAPGIEVQNEAMAKVRELENRIAEAERRYWIFPFKKRSFSKSICSND